MKIVKFFRYIYLLPVVFYKKILSPFFGNGCPYTPTCSSYFYQSVMKRGIIIGTVSGIYRVLRCNPFTKGGFDPVKEKFKGRYKYLL